MFKSLAVITFITIIVAGCAATSGPTNTSSTCPSPTPTQSASPSPPVSFTLSTLNDPVDPNFTEILGINELDKIVGFHSSPSVGFQSTPPYTVWGEMKFPAAVQTQALGLNQSQAFAGFYIEPNGQTNGFIKKLGVFTSYMYQGTPHTQPKINELLGINRYGIAVGFYDNAGVSIAYELNPETTHYTFLHPPGAVSSVATAINGKGDIVGYSTLTDGTVKLFLLVGGAYTELAYQNSLDTKAFGLNWQDQIMGSYVDDTGVTHGFFLNNPTNRNISWQSIDYPGATTTVLRSCNDRDECVGYYVDSVGTHGMFATPN